MKERLEALVWASLAGDSLALGAHWDYNPHRIKKVHGRVENLLPAEPDSYHDGKAAGDLTHYGDQELVRLESMAERGGFDPADFLARWRGLFENYDGYLDKATKDTLEKIEAGAGPEDSGSESHDLAGATRIAPLFLGLHQDPEALFKAARDQTKMTHNTQSVIDAAEFLARTIHLGLAGRPAVKAMEEAAGAGYRTRELAGMVEQGLVSQEQRSLKAIGHFGRDCAVESALPGCVHLIAKHAQDLEEALVESVMNGGDSAARAMFVGPVLAAALGPGSIPKRWREGLRQRERIARDMERVFSAR